VYNARKRFLHQLYDHEVITASVLNACFAKQAFRTCELGAKVTIAKFHHGNFAIVTL
jgi:hypothetical protein